MITVFTLNPNLIIYRLTFDMKQASPYSQSFTIANKRDKNFFQMMFQASQLPKVKFPLIESTIKCSQNL